MTIWQGAGSLIDLEFLGWRISHTRKSFFDKAVFGGYDTTQVDEFVEEARKLLSSLKKENEVLKQKAIDFLNDETRFVAQEYWNGVYLEETGDII